MKSYHTHLSKRSVSERDEGEDYEAIDTCKPTKRRRDSFLMEGYK